MRKLVLPDLEDSPYSQQQREAGGAAAAQHSAPEQNALRSARHTSEGFGAKAAGSGSGVAGQRQSTGCGPSSRDAQTDEEDSLEPFSVRLPASAHRGSNRRLRVLDDSDADSESPVSGEAAAEWDSDSSSRGPSPGSSSVEALSSGLRTAVRQLGSSYRLGSPVQADTRPSR